MGEQSICKLPSVSWIFKKPTLEHAAGRGCSEEDEMASVCTASKVSNLPLSPACTGRALDQRVQIFPCSKVYFNLLLCLKLSTDIYYYFGLIILDPLIMGITSVTLGAIHKPGYNFSTINSPLWFQSSPMHISRYMHCQVLSNLDSSKNYLMGRAYTS